jgi:hypothetical protein
MRLERKTGGVSFKSLHRAKNDSLNPKALHQSQEVAPLDT